MYNSTFETNFIVLSNRVQSKSFCFKKFYRIKLIKCMSSFVISKRLNGDYKFEFTSRKGKTIFTSNSFELRFECEAAIDFLKKEVLEIVFIKEKSTNGKFYFTLTIQDKELANSRKYTTPLLLEKGIQEIKKYLQSAEILDFSIIQNAVFENVNVLH